MTMHEGIVDESIEHQVDGWELAGFPGRLKVAAYLTADQYRLIVDALLDAQEHPLTGVGRDELFVAVRVGCRLRPTPRGASSSAYCLPVSVETSSTSTGSYTK
ncbi:hypothetical protein [Actinopolymorpha alba]|uniref:hypothetical protein n=1 Tax=Actinopolymorpha alba TaxID=533267 RepID=UPI00037097D0|nr:hypothetical protein [Actinopolymorpha alba]